jgi:hypothetical protein
MTTDQNTPPESLGSPESTKDSNFISSPETSKVDTIYSDFFQETSDGKISMGSKAKKSWLEVFTTVLSYVLPIAIIIVVLASFHVFLRTQETWGFAEKYQFLCPYMNRWVDIESSERGCNTISAIQTRYTEKKQVLQEDIIKRMNEYIPIKIAKNLIATSPEKKFIIDTYKNKVRVDITIQKFFELLEKSQYTSIDNIDCKGISIGSDGDLSTLCNIYGKGIGEDDSNGRLGSSRIEAISFIDELSNTTKNQFIFLNPPTSLGIEPILENGIFTTRTTIPVRVRYVWVEEKS